MKSQEEFDLLAAGYCHIIEFRERCSTDTEFKRWRNKTEAELFEAAISRHDLRTLRAGWGDVCGDVQAARWGPEFLREFQKRNGVALKDVRGKRSPPARLERVLSRGSIETPADLRVAQEQLDSVPEDNRKRRKLIRLIEEYYLSHPRD